jgi:hypothetical protein
MKIINYTVKNKSYPTVSVRGSILKDANGEPILDHGRFVTTYRSFKGARIIYDFVLLISHKGGTSWMTTSEAVQKFGKKPVRRELRELKRRIRQSGESPFPNM